MERRGEEGGADKLEAKSMLSSRQRTEIRQKKRQRR